MAELIAGEIIHAVRVNADPRDCWDALATAAGLDAWFTSGSEIDPRPGGRMHLRWVDWGPDRVNAEDDCVVLEADRGRRFVFQWHPDSDEYATTVEIDFLWKNGGAVVRLREYGYQNTPAGLAAMLECAAGWGEALTLMKMHMEHGLSY